ncbi:MAG: family 1 glycosylhydrolase [Lachnospiraceae bacterium]|nr:glycoside hydrolase family 1 protein [Lachnospiraceae bacterium]MEE3456691.1 family 1 glycosylhydrolase [Lachnospiraceae bacterium]
MRRFSEEFLLGAATAAHQVEGNNTLSDTWAQEQMPHGSYSEPSGDAVDHYHRYKEDILLLKEAGLNAYRFSIEWARIEPEEGEFSEEETEHYRSVIRFCRDHGIEPIVTLHHFSSPVWLIRKGGWEADTTPDDFARYAAYIAEQFGDDLNYVCTINEANMGIQISTVARQIFQQMVAVGKVQVGVNMEDLMRGSPELARENLEAFGTDRPAVFVSARTTHGDEIVMKAHAAARESLRKAAPHIKVGWTLSLHDVQCVPGGEEKAQAEWAEEFTHYLPVMADDDFLGVQNYSRTIIGPDGPLPNPEGAELTQMEYEYYPQGLENVLRRVAKDFHGDLIVTENGIATSDDKRRIAFLDRATQGVKSCIEEGLPVKGYCYWSLLDNYEWQKGYGMTFGLIGVNRATQVRTAKPSLYALGRLLRDD